MSVICIKCKRIIFSAGDNDYYGVCGCCNTDMNTNLTKEWLKGVRERIVARANNPAG